MTAQNPAAKRTELFLGHLSKAATSSVESGPLHAACIMLNDSYSVKIFASRDQNFRQQVASFLGEALTGAVEGNHAVSVHYATKLIALLLKENIMQEADLGRLISPEALRQYSSFNLNIPANLGPKKGPRLLMELLCPVSDVSTASKSSPTSAEVRKTPFSYVLSLLSEARQDPQNEPLLAATFSALLYEFKKQPSNKKPLSSQFGFAEVKKNILQLVTDALMEGGSPVAAHHGLIALSYLVSHSHVSINDCCDLTSLQALDDIKKSKESLLAHGFMRTAGRPGHDVFFTLLKDFGHITASCWRGLVSANCPQLVPNPLCLNKDGAAKAVSASFEAAARYHYVMGADQIRTLARNVTCMAEQADRVADPKMLRSALEGLGRIWETSKFVRPHASPKIIEQGFVVRAFKSVAAPVLRRRRQYEPDEVQKLMRFFIQLKDRRLLPEELDFQVKTYLAPPLPGVRKPRKKKITSALS